MHDIDYVTGEKDDPNDDGRSTYLDLFLCIVVCTLLALSMLGPLIYLLFTHR